MLVTFVSNEVFKINIKNFAKEEELINQQYFHTHIFFCKIICYKPLIGIEELHDFC